jgi:hypothetical protein
MTKKLFAIKGKSVNILGIHGRREEMIGQLTFLESCG